jgi:DNA-binding transcriptional LysR family regulator
MTQYPLRTIDLSALRENVRLIRASVPAETMVMAVVKADAYGHGIAPVAKNALAAGADWLAVARTDEGAVLRRAGVTAPVLVLGASTVPSKSLLPGKMMAFQRSHPECCCVVRGGDSEQIQQMVLDGDVQIGFVGSTDNRQQLCYERIARDRLVLITPNTPRFAKLHAQGILGRELLSEPLIFRDRGSGTQKMIDNYLTSREDGNFTPDVRFYTADPEMLQELVSMGAGVSILSALSVEERVKAGKLLCFELEENPFYRNIYMVYQRKGTLSELTKAFVAMMRSHAEE